MHDITQVLPVCTACISKKQPSNISATWYCCLIFLFWAVLAAAWRWFDSHHQAGAKSFQNIKIAVSCSSDVAGLVPLGFGFDVRGMLGCAWVVVFGCCKAFWCRMGCAWVHGVGGWFSVFYLGRGCAWMTHSVLLTINKSLVKPMMQMIKAALTNFYSFIAGFYTTLEPDPLAE